MLYREVDELRREAAKAFEVTDPERYGAAGPRQRAAQRHIVLQFTPFLDCSQTGLSGLPPGSLRNRELRQRVLRNDPLIEAETADVGAPRRRRWRCEHALESLARCREFAGAQERDAEHPVDRLDRDRVRDRGRRCLCRRARASIARTSPRAHMVDPLRVGDA